MRIGKLFLVLALLLAIAAVGAVAAGQLGFLRGTAPTDLGVRDGRLKPPSDTENSVSSQAALYPGHPQRAYADIAPLPLKGGDGPATMARIRAIVEGMGAKVMKGDSNYVYAQFTSRVMKFVDDVEFWFDPANKVIQVRSASRLGYGDMGVNRKRIETIRRALQAS